MKNTQVFKIVSLLALVLFTLSGFVNKSADSAAYKCMIQMTNYSGEGAYIVISLLNPDGDYEKTLYVQGDDDEWYSDITEWWQFHGKVRTDIDAITGATISGGERAISVIQIPNNKIDMGYKIRFESAVEDQEYYKNDVEFELTSESIKSKVEGHGFIRYVRMMPQAK
ncbi:flagellin biosynthesis protein FlgD [Flavivirga aquatica]|uniref:Flagellin biosynthesis protein FlgD n=1 Tax=Flavivirga aquatica TaxID=1849968 RepID=A0A1E5TDZ8_9FLAO|nr:DUF2271 domain-containing protein [Flavivirga aquatica]OEK09567.1 flagellin biosynthesis protein FlgD [Flavivirga aquatica]